MKNEFTLKQLFSIVDGRLSTNMSDIYDMLKVVAGCSVSTIGLPLVEAKLIRTNPKWFSDIEAKINDIKDVVGDDFDNLMDELSKDETLYKIYKI